MRLTNFHIWNDAYPLSNCFLHPCVGIMRSCLCPNARGNCIIGSLEGVDPFLEGLLSSKCPTPWASLGANNGAQSLHAWLEIVMKLPHLCRPVRYSSGLRKVVVGLEKKNSPLRKKHAISNSYITHRNSNTILLHETICISVANVEMHFTEGQNFLPLWWS